jgi:nitrate reductase gamma subunit
MDQWIDWARGPVFLFCLAFCILGLARLLLLFGWSTVRTWLSAGDPDLPIRRVLKLTLRFLFPFKSLSQRPLFSLTSILFHISLLPVPLFLAGHVVLWQRGLGVSWPALPAVWSDRLTLLAIATGLLLVTLRLTGPSTRAISRAGDYLVPLVVLLPFVSGYLVSHPGINPFPYQLAFLIHILSGDLLLLLIPLTKLSHVALFPQARLVSELGWHWPPGAGQRVAVALGKEETPV